MKKVFIEIGGGVAGHLSFLTSPEWRTTPETLTRLPEFFRSANFQWQGYIVEPVPENFLEIMTFKKRNDIQDIEYILGAVSGRSNFQRMVSYDLTNTEDVCHPMSSLVEPSYFAFEDTRKVSDIFHIKPFTLDELLDWVGIVPTLLRMDIEHAERDVFETFSWACRPYHIQIDHHNKNIPYFVDMFETKGYIILGDRLGADRMEMWATLDYH